MCRRLAALLCAICLSITPLAQAFALDAKQLREDIIAALDGISGSLMAGPLVYDEVKVWPQDGGYRVEIEGFASQPTEDDVWLDVGDVAFTVQESGDGLYRVVDISFPDSVSLRTGDGRQTGLLTYRLERFEGLWSSAIANFLDMDLLATNLRFGLTDGSLALSLDRVEANSRSRRGEDGRYDQDAHFRATNLQVEVLEYGTFDVGKINVEGTTKGFDLDAYAVLRRELEALVAGGRDPSEADLAALLERMADLNLFPREIAQRYRISEISAVDVQGQVLSRIAEVEWDLAASDMNQPLPEASFGIKQRGLDLGSAAEAQMGIWRELVPRDAGFEVAVERLPGQRLRQALLRAMALSAVQGGQGGMADVAPLNLMAELIPAFSEAGTRLRLPHFRMESKAVLLTAEGEFDVDSAAVLGFKGWMDFALVGLDHVIALLESEVAAGNTEGQVSLVMATWLRGLARREIDGEGRAIYRFALRLTADGQMLVNDKPFGLSENQRALAALAGDAEQTSVQSSPDQDLVNLVQEGRQLSKANVKQLESALKTLPLHLPTRARLLGFYFHSSLPIFGRTATIKARRRHILWLIENHPDSSIAGLPEATINPSGHQLADEEGYQQARELWLKQVERNKNNEKVQLNAAKFGQLPEKAVAETAPKAEDKAYWTKDANGCAVWNDNPQINKAVTWSGPCVNGKAHGKGVVQFFNAGKPNGDRYVGDYRNGKAHGWGDHTWPNGDRYVGEYRDDKRNGQGVYTFSSGNRYEGEFCHSSRHGHGVFTMANGDRYEGEFRHKLWNGTFTYRDGRQRKMVNSKWSVEIIRTLQAFEENVVDRPFAGRGWTTVIQSDETLTGIREDGSQLSGSWDFKDGYFCRELIIDGKSMGWDCQIVSVSGNEVTFARQRGKGEKVTYRFK